MTLPTILVVDDMPAVLRYVTHVLAGAGYNTRCAAGAKHALEILAADDGIDLVIADVVMPEMDGCELVAEISRRSPNLAVLLMSGYAGAAEVSPGVAFLSKPFKPADLLAKVAELLERERHPLQPETEQDSGPMRKPPGVAETDLYKERAG